MANVNFYPAHKSIHVPEGTTILEAARIAGILVESPCNGAGTCGKCKVKLDPDSLPNITHNGENHLSAKEESQGFVLSCQAQIRGNISVEVLQKQEQSLKILSAGKSLDIEFDSFIKKKYVQKKDLTYIYAGETVLGSEQGNTVNTNYGVVVDIGTTTLVTALLDINTGEEIETASALNPQSVHAQDVLSRIKFATEENGLSLMYFGLIGELNRMIDQVTHKAGIDKANIYEIIFSGNTCMLHLATNVNPCSLGKYPYTPQIVGGNHIKAANHQLNISRFGIIYLPPVVSAYVGADITSGILASELHHHKGVTLFVDIGTNGEMVIGLGGELTATSTAAGPAFEGMNITCGMRAGQGAVEFFNIEDDGSITIKTIGDSEATGICGSGLLDIVGELVAHGVINKNGRLVDPDKPGLLPSLKERLIRHDGKPAFRLTKKVYLTQKDIRQVQLAKGAVRSGIEFLLKTKGLKASKVDSVLIAGSFGYHLRAKSLINIGLLPKEFAGIIDFIGNTSKTGGQAFLLNKLYRQQMEKAVKAIDVLDLASYKDFDQVFVKCLGF